MMSGVELQQRLPWRHPFLLVDRVLDCTAGESIRSLKCVSASDPLLLRGAEGASLPSLLLLEGMSQTAALLFDLSYPDREVRALPMLGFASARLSGAAFAGDTVTFEVEAIKMTSKGGVFQARASVGERQLAEAELAFAAASAPAQEEGGK